MNLNVTTVILDMNYNITDVRDVALAQIVAMENPDAIGRHCFCNDAVHLSTVLQIIHEAFHDMDLPTRKVRNVSFNFFFLGFEWNNEKCYF